MKQEKGFVDRLNEPDDKRTPLEQFRVMIKIDAWRRKWLLRKVLDRINYEQRGKV